MALARTLNKPSTVRASDRWRRLGRQLSYRNPLYQALLDSQPAPPLLRQPRDVFAGDAGMGQQWLRGNAPVAGREFALLIANGKISNWLGPLSPLGFAELHGFRWLRHLHAVGGNHARQAARQLIVDWLDNFARWDDRVWALPVLAERLTGWLSQFGFYGAAADDAFRHAWMNVLWRQLRHLQRLYATQTAGIDRLRALKALLFAQYAFGDDIFANEDFTGELQEWLAAHILPDGCAMARSPSAQARILSDLLEIRGLFTTTQQPMPDGLSEAITAIARALRHLRHGDGGLAVFHHSFEDRAEALDLLLITANHKGRPGDALDDGGWQRLQAGRSLVLIDTGLNRCPHSFYHHAPLAMEFSVGRERLIVNCGSGMALSDRWRDAGQSLPAHSALDFPDVAAPNVSNWTINRNASEGQIWLELQHDGWQHSGIQHQRQLFLSADGEDLRGEDRLQRTGETNATPQAFVLRLHLHPKIQAVATANSVLLRTPSGQGWRVRCSGADVTLEPSVYMGQIGQLQRTQQIVLRGTLWANDACVKWALQKEGKK